MLTLKIPSEYGYVILVSVLACFVNTWLAMRVGSARKKYGIKYPVMYSESNNVFNCIQRAHQNFLENFTQFQVMLLLGGIHYPQLGAAAGLVWLLGRIVYAVGYSTGDPQKRLKGGFQYIGLLFLLFSTLRLGVGLLGWV